MNKGILFAVSAYIFWGIHPVYWKLLKHVDSIEIVSHRIFWSLFFFAIIISYRKEWKSLFSKFNKCNNKWIIILPAFLIGSNWVTYIWAVNAGYIIETSLGYFICPLISVLLGVIFLGEKLRSLQWFSVFIAMLGVFYMTFIYGQFPWISLFLASTWAVYGFLRKKSPLSSIEGLTLETTILAIPVVFYLTYLLMTNQSSYTMNLSTSLLLMGTGITSGLPLLVFIAAARLINLSLIGILQYIYPTLIFLLGAFVYNEQMSEAKLIGFVFIWLALIIYSTESIIFRNKLETSFKPISN
jgi:chloramphenicol-sensitive protein RarD